MKKYIKPESILVKIANEDLLAGSPEVNDVGTDATALGKGNMFWEDED